MNINIGKDLYHTGFYSSTDLIINDLFFPHHLFLVIIVYLEKSGDLGKQKKKEKKKVKSKIWLHLPFFIYFFVSCIECLLFVRHCVRLWDYKVKRIGPKGLLVCLGAFIETSASM